MCAGKTWLSSRSQFQAAFGHAFAGSNFSESDAKTTGTTVSHLVLSRLLHTEKWAWKQSWTVEDKGFMMVVPTARTLALTALWIRRMVSTDASSISLFEFTVRRLLCQANPLIDSFAWSSHRMVNSHDDRWTKDACAR